MTDVCRTCKAPVLWAITTPNGRWIPVDPDPVPNGNLLVTDDGAGTVLATLVPTDLRADVAGDLHVSHFATCPHADQHRHR